MKTLFITSFHPHISRNILLTPVLDILKQKKDLRIVIITSKHKVSYFEKTFGDKNVFIEGIRSFQASRTRRGLFFKRASLFLADTTTSRNRKKTEYYCKRKYFYYFIARMLGFLGKSFWTRRIIRWLDFKLSPKNLFQSLFEKYRPDVVFSTDILNEDDVSLVQEARRQNVLSIGMVRSWDNPTMAVARVFPDELIVGSKILFKEVVELWNYPEKDIVVTGNPHYDRYIKEPIMKRSEFFGHFNLNPNLPVILYAPLGDTTIGHFREHNDIDQYIMEFLGTFRANILVRFLPSDTVRLVDFKKPDNMAYDKPGVLFGGDNFGDREISLEDDSILISELYYSDVVVSGPTSIPLDAILLDKPSIMAEFYPSKPSFCNAMPYYRDHIQKVLKTRGIAHVKTKDELKSLIEKFIKNVGFLKKERLFIRSVWFSHIDGDSSKRLSDLLIKFINENNTYKHSK